MSVEKTNLVTSGQRIKKARMMAGIVTRREFKQKFGISPNTLQGWEQDKNKLSLKGANRLVEALWQENIMCSPEWLMHGYGAQPRVIDAQAVNQQLVGNPDKLADFFTQESRIAEEKSLFSKLNPHSIVVHIDDDAMLPLFDENTLVGGIYHCPTKAKEFYGWSCIVEFQHHHSKLITVRSITQGTRDDTVNLCGLNPASQQSVINYYDIQLTAFAPIIWIRKSLTF